MNVPMLGQPRLAPLTVGDLFCGAGGFSEGFRQSGFEIRWGIDNWKAARETFQKNHPRANAVLADVETLDVSTLGKVDVIIGSPPCIHFSPANKGGNGDKELGLRLVNAFFSVVKRLAPKYWVMENVPALLPALGLDPGTKTAKIPGGRIEIPDLAILNAVQFGTPQTRRRLFLGKFPVPSATRSLGSSVGFTLGDVVEALPDPRCGESGRPAKIEDPFYRGLSVRSSILRDHFEDPRWQLSKDDVRRSRREKTRSRVYGRMRFPDRLTEPTRTITATRTRGSRSTIVLPRLREAKSEFRTLTLRESAIAQGFPITYQFWASSLSDKDVLVGNAVCPPVARAIAAGIARVEGVKIPELITVPVPSELPPLTQTKLGVRRQMSERRRFRGVVPVDWNHDHRVELDNEFGLDRSRTPRWKTRIYLGYAKEYKCYELPPFGAEELLRVLTDGERPWVSTSIARVALLPVLERCLNGFPDGRRLQEIWSGRRKRGLSPDGILTWVGRCVDAALPSSNNSRMPVTATASLLSPFLVASGKEAKRGQPKGMTARTALSAVALSLVCARLNGQRARLETLFRGLLAGAPVGRRCPFPEQRGGSRTRTEAARAS